MRETRIWFIGSGPFAALCFTHMSEHLRFEKIVTGHPTKAGRGMKDRVSCVEQKALELGLSVERTGSLSQNGELLSALSDPPDIVFVVDFAQLIREPLLNAPRYGCLNIHPSLLPRWRGAAPIQRTLLNGDAVTGVTVFRLVEEMDAGPILAQASVPAAPTVTAAELFDILALTGSQMAVQGVESLIDSRCQFSSQNSEFATYAAKLTKAEAQVSWNQDYRNIHNAVRAFNSSGGAFADVQGKRLKLWKVSPVSREEIDSDEDLVIPGIVLYFMEGDPVVACVGGALRLQEVQVEGKRRISGADWACGGKLKKGGRLA